MAELGLETTGGTFLQAGFFVGFVPSLSLL